MITRLGTAPRARGLDYRAFQAHWSGDHADLARELPGLRRYVQNHALLQDGVPPLGYVGFDACSETDFDDVDAMDAAFASQHYRSSVTDDERLLIDRSGFRLGLMQSRTLYDAEPNASAVKLMTFWHLHPGATLRELEELLDGPGQVDARAAGALRHRQMIEIPGAHASRAPAVCNAVDVLWLADQTAAQAFLLSEHAHATAYEMAAACRGATRLMAREITILAAPDREQ